MRKKDGHQQYDDWSLGISLMPCSSFIFFCLLIATAIADDVFWCTYYQIIAWWYAKLSLPLRQFHVSIWILTTSLEKCIVRSPSNFFYMASLLEFLLVFHLNICFSELVWNRHWKSWTGMGNGYAIVEKSSCCRWHDSRVGKYSSFFSRFRVMFLKPDDCFRKNGDLKEGAMFVEAWFRPGSEMATSWNELL